jgi:hypothetical protein
MEHKKAEDIINAIDYKKRCRIVIAFSKWLERQQKKHLCIFPEIDIARYCCGVYNGKANDKAEVVFKPKESIEIRNDGETLPSSQ